MTDAIFSCQQEDSIKLLCEINLKKLLPAPKEREKFDEKWNDFLESDPCNKDLFDLKGDLLKYQSEQLIPTIFDNRPPLLIILGNPASHSVKEGMFFSFEGNKKEHRFWKDILNPAEILNFDQSDNNKKLSISALNKHRKNQLLDLDYNSPFRIGLCVYISMPSAASGKWSGIAGVHKLLGINGLRRLEKEEQKRVLECAKKFLSPNGIAIAFQKNAWNGLKFDEDIPYSKDNAREGKLKGTLKDMPNIPLLGVPPTRLSSPCSVKLRQLLEEQGYSLPKNTI